MLAFKSLQSEMSNTDRMKQLPELANKHVMKKKKHVWEKGKTEDEHLNSKNKNAKHAWKI